jgi:cytochrome P450/acyl-CoA synthetase (AMP-forming)/AMP-acid ligase II/thioesterase domain-containing protein/acyl-CoA-binding protein/acyl carrier protein
MSDLDAQFSQATQTALSLPSGLGNAEKLALYALYKQATSGENTTAKPGFLNIVGMAKWQAWTDLTGTPQEVAKQRYIDLIAQLMLTAAKSPPAITSVTDIPEAIKNPHNEEEHVAEEATLDVCLRQRAIRYADKDVFTFLNINAEPVDRLNYQTLHNQACAIATPLLMRDLKGQRVLLLFEPGLQFAAAFYGCIYAGAIAVPAYPPDPTRFERTLSRLQAIAADSTPQVVLTSASILALAKQLLTFTPDLARLEWIALEQMMAEGNAGKVPLPLLDPQDIALIQYTSGSTSTPKGVVVSHQNLLVNARMMQKAANMDNSRIIASWLPLYHDLGLMTGIILPVIAGARTLLMSPLDFLKRPALWLSAINQYQATDTAGPNFALDLCVQKISYDDGKAWDLNCLRVCLIGAEPVRFTSVKRFLQRFEKSGLSRESLYPGYGLAEAVVGVSCGPVGSLWRAVFVDADALARHRVLEVEPSHPRALPLVACGTPIEEMVLTIVNPETGEHAGEDDIGEVWLSGPHIAMGYWQKSAESKAVFMAHLAGDDEHHWLRTGDFGFIKDSHLYITGRMKDVLIIRGKNYYPQDLETAVELCHQRVRRGTVIAFSVDENETECVVVAAEVDLRLISSDLQRQQAFGEIVAAISHAINQAYGLAVLAIALLKPRTIDKTSSGKLARQSCRQRYLDNTLDCEYMWHARGEHRGMPPAPAPYSPSVSLRTLSLMEQMRSVSPPARQLALVEFIEDQLAQWAVCTEMKGRFADARFEYMGLDSLATMALISSIEHALQVDIPLDKFLSATSVGAFAGEVLEMMEPEATDLRSAQKQNVHPRLTQAVALQKPSFPTPLFCIGGLGGTVHYLSQLSEALVPDRPFIAFQAVGIDGTESPLGSVEEMAQCYLQEIKAIQPQGPYVLVGHSFGGMVAYEIARHLTEQGEYIDHLFLIDTSLVKNVGPVSDENAVASESEMALYEMLHTFRLLDGKVSLQEGQRHLPVGESELRQQFYEEFDIRGKTLENMRMVYQASFSAMGRYQPLPYPGPVTVFRAEGGFPQTTLHPLRRVETSFADSSLGWTQFCPVLNVYTVPGDHFSIVLSPNTRSLAEGIISTLSNTSRLSIELQQLIPPKYSPVQGRAIDISPEGVRFDPFHPEIIRNPHPVFRQLQDHASVFYDGSSAWWVTRHADVSAGLRDRRFSVDTRKAINDKMGATSGAIASQASTWARQQEMLPLSQVYNNFMLMLDPPRHQQLRRFFSPIFQPAMIKRWRTEIERRVDDLIADMCLRHNPDIMQDLALPLPVSIISTMLGTPQQDTYVLQSWAHDIFRGIDPMFSPDSVQHANTVALDFMQYMTGHIERRRALPGKDDLLGMLLVTNDSQVLTASELAANCILLFAAGFETTTSVIGNSVLSLLRNPDQLQLLRKHPELIENAVEEFLRYEGAVRVVARTALEDVEMGGSLIHRGDSVLFVLSAANRDPAVFPEPDKLDITRNARQHVAFSHGIHYCLGAPLARIEIQSAISALIQHDISLVPGEIAWRDSMIFRSLEHLLIKIT